MKAYMAIVDAIGNVATSVVTTATPVQMLQQLMISATTGEFDLKSQKISGRVAEVNQFWVEHNLVDLSVNEVLNRLADMFAVCEDDQMEEAVLDLMGSDLTEDPLSFIATLRDIFNGEVEDLSEMTEEQTFLMAVISL